MDQDVASLKESVHALAEAMQLLDKIYEYKPAAKSTPEYRRLVEIIQATLSKTA